MISALFFISTVLHATPLIPNGTLAENQPEVILLTIKGESQIATCTGTAVGPDTVLTAGHCFGFLAADEEYTVQLSSESIRGIVYSPKVFVNPIYDIRQYEVDHVDLQLSSIEWSELEPKEKSSILLFIKKLTEKSRSDLAVVKIPKEANLKKFKRIKKHTAPIERNKKVVLVGYGHNDETAAVDFGGGVKREGTNQISVSWNGVLFTTGLIRDSTYWLYGLWTQADGKDVGVGKGDSGGPMLDLSGNVIGVNVSTLGKGFSLEAIRSLTGKDGTAMYAEVKADPLKTYNLTVDLSHPECLSFLKQAERKGFHIRYAE